MNQMTLTNMEYSNRSAIEQAGMDIGQVSDRFHLLKGLTDAAEKIYNAFAFSKFYTPNRSLPL